MFKKFNYIVLIFLLQISEWGVNIQRDTYSSYVGHHGLMQYFATALNEPTAKLRFQYLEVSHYDAIIVRFSLTIGLPIPHLENVCSLWCSPTSRR